MDIYAALPQLIIFVGKELESYPRQGTLHLVIQYKGIDIFGKVFGTCSVWHCVLNVCLKIIIDNWFIVTEEDGF